MDHKNKIDLVLVNLRRINKVGVFALAAYVRSQGLTVKILDGSAVEVLDKFKELLAANNILVIGFTATTDIIDDVSLLAQQIRALASSIYLMIGGYHATTLPQRTLQETVFDLAVVGEGELTTVEILQKLKIGQFPTKAPGCYEKVRGEIIFNGSRPFLAELDALPFLAFDLVDFDKYLHAIRLKSDLRRVVLLLISRGCPFDCIFCASKQMWQRRFRMYSPVRAIEFIKWLFERYHIDGISFLDDELLTNRKYILEFCDLLVSSGLANQLKWSCQARVTSIDAEVLKKVKAAGCVLIRFGLESGSESVLAYLKKNSVKVSQALAAVKLCKEFGVPTFGSFIIGSPHETLEDILKTIEFVETSGLTSAEVFSLVPYPGTDIYQYAQEHNLLEKIVSWSDFKIEGGDSHSVLHSHHFTAAQIDQIRSYIEWQVVFNLNNKLPHRKLNHRRELNRILKGDLSYTVFSPLGRRRINRQRIAAKIFKAVRNPALAFKYIVSRLVKI